MSSIDKRLEKQWETSKSIQRALLVLNEIIDEQQTIIVKQEEEISVLMEKVKKLEAKTSLQLPEDSWKTVCLGSPKLLERDYEPEIVLNNVVQGCACGSKNCSICGSFTSVGCGCGGCICVCGKGVE